ncbi:MAG: metallophosphoesterase [Nitrososphaeria archaeon]
MRVGIVSDSHDNLSAIGKALNILRSEKVDFMVHAGDIISPFAARLFLELDVPSYFTFGNNDGEKVLLAQVLSNDRKCRLIWPKATLDIDNFKIALMHGEDEEMIESLALSGRYSLIVYGHWHKIVNRRTGGCLIVNPGELCGYLTGRSTLAIVDLQKRDVKVVEVK